MKNNYDAIIIGGGLGGLTAGATLAKKGFKILLLEQHYIVGGCATTFKRKDFVMEVGLHEMDGLNESDMKIKAFNFLDVFNNVDFIKIPNLFRYKGNGIDFIQPHGENESQDALIKQFPKEAKSINKFFKFMYGVLNEIPNLPLEKWKQNLLLPLMPFFYPNLTKASLKNLGKWLDYYFKDPSLKLILQGNLMYYHNDPYSMSMVYFCAAQASYFKGGGHFIKGGSQKLSNHLKNVIEINDGQVLLGKKANKILVKDGKINGVTYKDKFNSESNSVTIYSNIVIANLAIPLLENLLPRSESKYINKLSGHFKNSVSLLTIYLGFKKEIKDLGNNYYSTFFYGKDVNSIHDVKSNNVGSWQNRTFIFVDYSQIDSGLSPKGKSFGSICTIDDINDWKNLTPENYKIKKNKIAEILINRLENEIPGIKEEIEYVEVGTAKTIQKFTSNPDGTPYGFAQTPKQSGINRTPLKSKTKGLHFASAWSFPGGGFTGAILSGFLCGENISKLNKPQIEKQHHIKDQRIVKLLYKEIIAKNTLEITLQKPEFFRFKAGQYVILDLLNHGSMNIDMPIRALSLASHPSDKHLKFTVRLSDSSFKQTLNKMELESKVQIYGPMGDFKIQRFNRNIVFLISGIGITPIIPLITELEIRKHHNPITLFYSNKTKSSATYHEHLKNVILSDFKYIPNYSKANGRINGTKIKESINSYKNTDFYIVGTDSFTLEMKKILAQNGVDKESIIVDNFG